MSRSLRTTSTMLALALAAAACSASAADPTSDQDAHSSVSSSPVASIPAESEPADAPAPTAGTELNACEIVTAADIAAALAIDPAGVGEGEPTESPTTLSPGHTECNYTGDWGGLVVNLTPEDGANLFDAARGSYDDASDREIAGADGAFYSAEASRGFFWKGAVTVMLQISHLTVDADRDAATTAIGQAALDRVD